MKKILKRSLIVTLSFSLIIVTAFLVVLPEMKKGRAFNPVPNGTQPHPAPQNSNLNILDTWGTVYFEYDYQGRRTRKTRSDGTNHFYFWDGNRLIAEQHGSRRLWFFYDDQGISGMSMSNQDFFFRRNIFGDVIAIYCQNGILQGRYEYCPWGNTTIIPYANNLNVMNWNPFRWRGKYMDQETGFYLMHSRFYDPVTGRFINADDPRMLFLTAPMGQSGANLFAYALNNPIMFRDDSGYFARSMFNWIGNVIGACIELVVAVIAEVPGFVDAVFGSVISSFGIIVNPILATGPDFFTGFPDVLFSGDNPNLVRFVHALVGPLAYMIIGEILIILSDMLDDILGNQGADAT
ncbi:MAG: RHS repeat-associated core domain-containing protein [Firmicutes bacterium]|nr:RHS repeat-associated core domain-containing protein [Bacillota bacterium]